jgi:hypothetical protein
LFPAVHAHGLSAHRPNFFRESHHGASKLADSRLPSRVFRKGVIVQFRSNHLPITATLAAI